MKPGLLALVLAIGLGCTANSLRQKQPSEVSSQARVQENTTETAARNALPPGPARYQGTLVDAAGDALVAYRATTDARGLEHLFTTDEQGRFAFYQHEFSQEPLRLYLWHAEALVACLYLAAPMPGTNHGLPNQEFRATDCD
ncbi:MAG: hypothetical protein ACK417_09215 [Bacteroidia bacterium]